MFWLWLVLVAVVTLVIAWAFHTAQRLNRLHIRTDNARQSLQAALDRRAALVGALKPEAASISAAAEAVPLLPEQFEQRAAYELEVSKVISDWGGEPPAAVVDAAARVQLAHRFYNDAVADTRALRVRPLVRLFCLGGTARLPEFFEFPTP
ncbi:hypothetical protein [Corynebacterium freiburgense]|uniref:hypothetical protein n=1 Tax=Corynebacterium freiburgense TaxID=556548 RepID=UPI0004043C59|nr:hypothetical protein [Corynebacterium freiburgense]WJZ02833.1 hypothetical protein CFREI_07740 [Corynebacterium freiburgense]